jgi:sirohydrochlorin cobaltochelatase
VDEKRLKVGVVLVGHGQLPKDLPPAIKGEYLSLKFKVHRSAEEEERLRSLERLVLKWPRNEFNDPYAHSLRVLAEELKRVGSYDRVWIAFNEFCEPTLEEALDEAAHSDSDVVVIVTTMTIRGGEHAEEEIPAQIERLKPKMGNKLVIYAWPIDPATVAEMLRKNVERHLQLAFDDEVR